ncbi:MAG TPA: hypothetical protein VLS93_14055 [Anaeromyxobacteraceae bacterium]|nr:hypothetical protein [Anaeromyxobacteraceae bacterium]
MAHTLRRLGVAASTLGVAALVSGCGPMSPPPAEPAAGARAGALTETVCTATGGHDKHAMVQYGCSTCHLVGGSLCFDPAGAAYAPGRPAPSFDVVGKTCSNVACHGMYSGIFTYSSWDWGCDCPVEVSVAYEGNMGSTPSWYATGAGCSACHGNPPPRYPAWHGSHALGSFADANDCQLCHPDALAQPGTGVGYALNTATTCTVNGVPNSSCALLHANGSVNVTPRWTSKCFPCH